MVSNGFQSVRRIVVRCWGVAYMKDFGGHAIADDRDLVDFGYHRGV